MRRLFLACSFGCLALLVFWPPVATYACSLAPTTFGFAAPPSEVIAIGTVTESEEHVAKFEVETYLKGNVTAPTLTVMNHTVGSIGASCETTMGPGGRFPVGSRVLLFLVPDQTDSDADWQPYGLAYDGVWMINNDSLNILDDQTFQDTPVSVDEAIKLIQGYTSTEPFTPQAQPEAPTELAADLPVIPLVLGGIAVLAGVVALFGWQRSRRSA